jgi:hypothetical protein
MVHAQSCLIHVEFGFSCVSCFGASLSLPLDKVLVMKHVTLVCSKNYLGLVLVLVSCYILTYRWLPKAWQCIQVVVNGDYSGLQPNAVELSSGN